MTASNKSCVTVSVLHSQSLSDTQLEVQYTTSSHIYLVITKVIVT